MASKDPAALAAKKRKEKLLHPQSRKAGQLDRKQLRKTKLRMADSKKIQKAASKSRCRLHISDIPDVQFLSVRELHQIVQQIWLTRHDSEIESEQLSRRKGRPPSTKEINLMKLKEHETNEYHIGLEVVDLTNPANVELFRRWKQDDSAYLDILRYVRISSQEPNKVVVSRPGKHQNLKFIEGAEDTRASIMIDKF